MKRWLIGLLCFWLTISNVVYAEGEEVEISAPSAILMEASTGTVIYEKDADTKRPPASITKIMTLLLIFDAIDEGKINLQDEVTTSEYAASMGGSQVYLEPGEVQTVETLIKCIAVASANDACVAMSEYICGNEAEFVNQMNEKAKELGMNDTNFENCNGLEAEGHMTTARDIAIMSRELIAKHPEIRDYCMIWQENIVHNTRNGASEFGLTNTNKLVRHYEYATGLKTGYTSIAKFCISATGEKDGVELIAVIMAADNSTQRNQDAVTLLNYGFGKCQKYEDDETWIEPATVLRGKNDTVEVTPREPFNYIDTSGTDLSQIRKEIEIGEISAPIEAGEKVGELRYYMEGSRIGTVDIITKEAVEEITYGFVLENLMKEFFAL